MKYLVYSAFVLLLTGQPVTADVKSDVGVLLQEKIDKVISILRDNEMEKEIKKERILDTVTPIFDFDMIAKLSLGKKYWVGLSEEKQVEYSDLFIKRMQESYLEKLDIYEDEDVAYEAPQEVKEKIYVSCYLLSKDSKIEMLYKFYKAKEEWKIYDVEIQGVSVVQTYRTQFHDVMKAGGIDELLAKLQTSGQFKTPEARK